MKNLFRIDSPFVQKMSLVFDLMLINILWLICCIPILTIGASTTAMHAAVYTLADDTTGYVRKFFRVFRDSFVQSTLSMLLFAALATILCVDILECSCFRKVCAAFCRLFSGWVLFSDAVQRPSADSAFPL